jgi:hypothetical protein
MLAISNGMFSILANGIQAIIRKITMIPKKNG